MMEINRIDGRECHFHKVDPMRNSHRFYHLSLRHGLFGDPCLVRSWGRIGTQGHEMIEWFSTGEDASWAFFHAIKRRKQRGYTIIDI